MLVIKQLEVVDTMVVAMQMEVAAAVVEQLMFELEALHWLTG